MEHDREASLRKPLVFQQAMCDCGVATRFQFAAVEDLVRVMEDIWVRTEVLHELHDSAKESAEGIRGQEAGMTYVRPMLVCSLYMGMLINRSKKLSWSLRACRDRTIGLS